MRFKGRHWILLWLAVFLLAATAVITRTSAGYRAAEELGGLRHERIALEAQRAELESRIRELSGRRVMEERTARDLGLHHPTDSEFTIFRLPARPGTDH